MSAPRRLRGGAPLAGFPVGILCLATRHPLMPGNAQHAQSFRSPPVYHILDTDQVGRLLAGDPALQPLVLDGVRALEALGVGAIVGACGSFAYYQRAATAAANVPVALSVMALLPWLLSILPPHRSLGILCAVPAALTDRALAGVGLGSFDRLVIEGVCGAPAFDSMLNGEDLLDVAALEGEVRAATDRLLARDPSIGAILLQCSELPPFASLIEARSGLPVFDIITLADFLAACVFRTPFHGLGRWQA